MPMTRIWPASIARKAHADLIIRESDTVNAKGKIVSDGTGSKTNFAIFFIHTEGTIGSTGLRK
jgi:hypothetical protein